VEGWRVMGVLAKAVSDVSRASNRSSIGVHVVEEVVVC
jgi:hypothetical protein